MNRNKILMLTYPRSGENAIADIVKQYFNERRGLSLDLSYTGPDNPHLNHVIGGDWRTDLTQTPFLNVISNDFYFLTYYYFSSWVVPATELITHIQNEDMTVVRVTRDITEWVISHMNALFNVWPGGPLIAKDPSQATIDSINAAAASMVITDYHLTKLSEHWNLSNQLFDQIGAAGAINFTANYDTFDFSNPIQIMGSFFLDPVTVDPSTVRPNDLLTQATRDTIIANNDLTNRISQFF
jgi:hypothetical protein